MTHHTRHREHLRFLGLACLLSLSLMLAGCASHPQFEDPVAVMVHSDDPARRMAAAKQAEASHRDDPARIAALHEMLWKRGRGSEERQYAIDQLMAYDEKAFHDILARRIVLIQDPATLRYVIDLAVGRNWRDLTPAIVRSYARPMVTNTPGPRPEIAALEALNPGRPVEQVVFDVFANADDQADIAQQTAAWELLRRLTDTQGVMKLLADSPDRTPLVVDLKAAAASLHALPVGKEGVLRLAHLRDPSRQSLWNALADRVASLTDAQKQGLELRHMPVLLMADRAWLAADRDQLIRLARQRLEGAEHHLRGPTYDGPMRDYPQDFATAARTIAWADLVTLLQVMRAIEQPVVRVELFRQAGRDHQDTTTEHGGVLLADEKSGQMVARAFDPMYRQNDYKFHPSQAMIEATYAGLVHYHFHAQSHRNRDYAGPGMGDMRMARNMEMHCIVLTFINADTLNVDLYLPDGLVIDLGSIHR